MSDRLRLSRRLALLALVGWLAAGDVQAQAYRSYQGDDRPSARGWQSRPSARGRQDRPPARGQQNRPSGRQLTDPDQAARAARRATGGRVLGVQGAERNGRPGYRVRILQPDGRVRNFHYDPDNGAMRD